MKLSDFPFFSSELIQFTCDDNTSNWLYGSSVTVQAHGNDFWIRQGDLLCVAQINQNKEHIALLVERGLVLWVLRNRIGNILQLQFLDLVQQIELNLNEDMAFAVEESIAEQLNSKGEISDSEVSSAIAWLKDKFLVEDDAGGSQLDRIFLGHFDNDNESDFVIFGDGWRGSIKRENNKYKLERLTRLKDNRGRIAMAVGTIFFQDSSVAARMQSPEQKALLDAALRDNGGYLELWQKYGELEWKQATDCATELGSIRFTNAKLIPGESWTWYLSVDIEKLHKFKQRWRSLGLSNSTQVELGESELEISNGIKGEFRAISATRQRPIRGEIRFQNDGLELILPQDRRSESPPSKGYLYYSLAGDEAVQSRRARARDSIKEGRRMPQLSYLLEGLAPPVARRRQITGLSAAVKGSFKGEPTERQKLALEVAVNTPDIALIVGPPGTGKTQVISALKILLSGDKLNSNLFQHQVLISSYQHDAVDNALNRGRVFGLPSVRIGGRNIGVDPVAVWCEETQKVVKNKLDSIEMHEPWTVALNDLSRRITALRLASFSSHESQSQFQEIDNLIEQLDKFSIRLSAEIKDRWNLFHLENSKLNSVKHTSESSDLIRIINSLRTSQISFLDDGPDKVHHVLRALRRANINLEKPELMSLERLSKVAEATDEDIKQLVAFKNFILDQLIPDYRPPKIKQALNTEILDLLGDIESAISTPLRNSRRGISAVVNAYCDALIQSPNEARRAVRDYSSVVGATCQQAAGKAMSSLKELSDLDASEGIQFETVLIDEAARANPLDLFVPMAMAKRRIVLVGDHRQLPHLVQRELEDELIEQQNLTEIQAKSYEQSLFERLVKQLREQEKVDNIKRVVMLDTQYRMHPTLGDFISQQFYESEGLGVLQSGRSALEFQHEIPGYEGRCAAWLDVPLHLGKEERFGTSRIRKVEAQSIAKEVRRIVDACGQTISIGIISFYRSQCDQILQSLLKVSLATEEDGELAIARNYRKTDSGEEWLRVGTVDAFQGKEFDVVFLSIVRANDLEVSDKLQEAEHERLLNNKFGHLRLANRLNVAMSRQRKLLVVVGDKRMAQEAESEDAVPALAKFLKLCQMEMTNGR